MSTDAEATNSALAQLATWVVKDGVGLGGLSFAVRDLALAEAWAGLPTGALGERARLRHATRRNQHQEGWQATQPQKGGNAA